MFDAVVERVRKKLFYLAEFLCFSSENEGEKNEKPQDELMVGPIAVVSLVFSLLADTVISLSTDCPSVFILFSAPFFLYLSVVQVCRQVGHNADYGWDSYGHNQGSDVSLEFHCVWKADEHFNTELQDVLPQHQR